MRAGSIERQEHEYKRHGTRCLFANFEVATGRIIAPSIGPTRTNEEFAAHIEKTIAIDLDGGTLSVRRSLKVTDHGLDFGPTKNKASRRSVPLNKSAVAALKAHRLRQNEERLRLGELWEDQDLVFPSRVGKPINPSNLYHREYKPLLKRAGLEDEGFTFHSLRHTFASALCNKRVYPKVIQSLLGHSSITQTMDTYSHLMGGTGGDAVDGLDEDFG